MTAATLHSAASAVLAAEAAERGARSAIAGAVIGLEADAVLALPEPVRLALADYFKAAGVAREARTALAAAKAHPLTTR